MRVRQCVVPVVFTVQLAMALGMKDNWAPAAFRAPLKRALGSTGYRYYLTSTMGRTPAANMPS
jgi:hypothetical protein